MILDDIYNKLKHTVDVVYRGKGLSSNDIRKYFEKTRNFRNLVKSMGDLKHVYDEGNYELSFENEVKNILFDRILLDRDYYERDNPRVKNESVVVSYKNFTRW